MFIAEYIHNIEEAVRFCERYGISYALTDGEFSVNKPSSDFLAKFTAMEDAARQLEGFVTDHPNCFLSDAGDFIVTFSNYDGELTEKNR